MDGQDLTMIQVDLIQMDDYPVGSCAINPTAFLLYFRSKRNHKLKGVLDDIIRGFAKFNYA